tara:strand:+ start:61 stop:567 length:507 start_codon:yes stop_codon:yes gene_type:complete
MIEKKVNKNFLINLILVFCIFFLDRISKLYVISAYKNNLDPFLYNSDYLNIYLIWNEGIAFGLFSSTEDSIYNFLTLLIFIIIIILLFMTLRSDGMKKYSLLFIIGGAIGNLFDRFFYKAVPDFIDFHIGDFHWFIFNIADIFISIGVILMILLEITAKNNLKNNEKY